MSEPWPPEQDVYYKPTPVTFRLVDGDLELKLRETRPSRPQVRWAATQVFDMIDMTHGRIAGAIHLRYADVPELVFHGGHIGYHVDQPFRGRHFSARAVRLILPLAWRSGMKTVWVTCDPTNAASKRNIELAGGTFVESREIPESSPLYSQGRRWTLRFRFDFVASPMQPS